VPTAPKIVEFNPDSVNLAVLVGDENNLTLSCRGNTDAAPTPDIQWFDRNVYYSITVPIVY